MLFFSVIRSCAFFAIRRVLSLHSYVLFFFFLMIRRPPRSTLDRSSAASDVYKRQGVKELEEGTADEFEETLASQAIKIFKSNGRPN